MNKSAEEWAEFGKSTDTRSGFFHIRQLLDDIAGLHAKLKAAEAEIERLARLLLPAEV